jgi:hypothetical protein
VPISNAEYSFARYNRSNFRSVRIRCSYAKSLVRQTQKNPHFGNAQGWLPLISRSLLERGIKNENIDRARQQQDCC